MSVIEDCLGYRSEKKHQGAMFRMIELMDVDKIDSEGIINEYRGLPVPDMESLDNHLNEICLSDQENTIRGESGGDDKDDSRYP